MEETLTTDEEAAWERRQIDEIEEALNALNQLQGLFLASDPAVVQANDLGKAHGRRCVLGIVGLKHHHYQKFFEVSLTGVRVVPPYEHFNTYIAAPADSVLRVMKGVLSGDTSAFAAEWARGKARLIGERKIHDGFVFSEVFRRLALLIKKYREL